MTMKSRVKFIPSPGLPRLQQEYKILRISKVSKTINILIKYLIIHNTIITYGVWPKRNL